MSTLEVETSPSMSATRGISELSDSTEELKRRIAELEAKLAEKDDPSPPVKPTETHVDHARLVISGPVFGLKVAGVSEEEHLSRRELLAVYLDQIISATRFARLEIIDPQAERPGLADIFIRLSVSERTGDAGIEPDDDEETQRLALQRFAETLIETIPASAFVAKFDRVAITGKPGSGKTTLSDMLALCLAGELSQISTFNADLLGDQDAWPEDLRGRNAPLPVRVELRDFAAGILTSGNTDLTLWQFIEGQLGDSLAGFGAHLKTHLVRHGGIALLDGLDEVPEANRCREWVKNAVADFAGEFVKVRILLTSRTYAYQHQDWAIPGFEESELLPLTEEQWNPFIEDWYANRPEFKSRPDQARARAALLNDRIADRAQLQNLAQRPLLLTLIVHLDTKHSGQLPDNREELYDEAVKLLLDTWEGNKRIQRQDPETGQWNSVVITESAAEFLQADRTKIERALESLAFDAHKEQGHEPGPAAIKETALLGKLASVAGRELNAELLQEYVRDRAGILTNDGHEIYRFPHRSFQEYLAARHLNHKSAREIAELFLSDPDRWREVFLLSGARLLRNTSDKFWSLCRKLCPQPSAEVFENASDKQWLAAALVGQLFCETGAQCQDDDETATRSQVIEWLVAILKHTVLTPEDRAMAGSALGWLGDPRPGVAEFDENGIPAIDWVTVDPEDGEPFEIARYPVTVAQYSSFVEAGGYQDPRWWKDEEANEWKSSNDFDGPERYRRVFQTPNHPQVGLSWFEARAFCSWLSHETDREVSLPGDREWLAITQQGEHDYPWGDWDEDSPAKRCNMSETELGYTSAVACFAEGQAKTTGVHDLAGNVWEWQNKSKGKERLRVLRGGAFNNRRDNVRSAFRLRDYPDGRFGGIGFRVSSSPSSSL